MFQLVTETHGKKNLKAMDLTKAMIEKFGAEACDKQLCKHGDPAADGLRAAASTRYFGGSYITLPPDTPQLAAAGDGQPPPGPRAPGETHGQEERACEKRS